MAALIDHDQEFDTAELHDTVMTYTDLPINSIFNSIFSQRKTPDKHHPFSMRVARSFPTN